MQSRLFFAGLFALALAAPSLTTPRLLAQEGGETAHPRPAMPRPVNLQVLPKDISSADLMKIMHGFTGSLGVQCGFCHEMDPQTHRPNFASDAKPDKGIARTMLRMTHTINQEYISQIHDPDAMPEQKHVTCGTCHRGHSMPEPFVPAAEHHEGGEHHEGAMPEQKPQ